MQLIFFKHKLKCVGILPITFFLQKKFKYKNSHFFEARLANLDILFNNVSSLDCCNIELLTSVFFKFLLLLAFGCSRWRLKWLIWLIICSMANSMRKSTCDYFHHDSSLVKKMIFFGHELHSWSWNFFHVFNSFQSLLPFY
jgi:hypothetical protein